MRVVYKKTKILCPPPPHPDVVRAKEVHPKALIIDGEEWVGFSPSDFHAMVGTGIDTNAHIHQRQINQEYYEACIKSYN